MPTSPFQTPSFLAPDVADWRLVLIYDAARGSGLLEVLPATVADAAERAGLQPVAVRAVLEALLPSGIAQRDEAGVVSLGPAAPDDDEAAQLSQHAMAIRRWSTGIEPRLRGEDAPKSGPFRLRDWLASMAVGAVRPADVVAELVADRQTGRVGASAGPLRALDLGGGHGRYAAALATRGYEVTMQDRPDVLAVVDEEGWLDGTGVITVAGDFHQSLPEGPFDVVLAAGIMHTMSPERAAALLRRAAGLLSAGGLIVIRTMLRNADSTTPLFAVQMLVAATGGDTHRLEDYQRWLAAAGMTEPEVVGLENGSLLISARA